MIAAEKLDKKTIKELQVGAGNAQNLLPALTL